MCIQFLSALFVIMISLTMALFSEIVLISNRCGLMPNLIKKSWTVPRVDAHIGRDKKREFLMTPIVKISNLGHYKKFMETIIQRTFHCYTTHYQFHPCSSARAAALYVHGKYNFSSWMEKKSGQYWINYASV